MQSTQETPAKAAPSGRLLRVLGVVFGIAVTIGGTIGAGILRTPGTVAQYLPSVFPFLLVWVLGGLYALVAAPSFAELSTIIPRSGGHYVFARYALGEYPGFVIGWSDWLGNCGSTASVAIVIAEYLRLLVPRFQGHETAIAVSVIIGLALLQLRGIRLSSTLQNMGSLLKTLAFLALVAACFLMAKQVSSSLPYPTLPLPHGFALVTALVLSLQAVIYAYDGWYGIIYFSEETRNPDTDGPRSIFGGVLSLMAIYLLLNAAMVHVLPLSALAGQPLALGTAAKAIWGAQGDTVIQVLTVISMLAAMNAFQLQQCRILFSMSVDGLVNRSATHVNVGGTPDVAHGISTAAALLFLTTGTFEKVIAVLAFFFVTNYLVGLVSIIVLRRREPERERPYRAWGYPWTTYIALIAYGTFMIGAIFSDTRNSVYALIILAASYPLYRVLKMISGRQIQHR